MQAKETENDVYVEMQRIKGDQDLFV